MRFSLDEMVQREHHYAIVDEVDSILIDEARTPLIISGRDRARRARPTVYEKVDRIIPRAQAGGDHRRGQALGDRGAGARATTSSTRRRETVSLTEQGIAHCERLLGVENLYDPAQIESLHHIHQALKAHHIFADVDYVVKDGDGRRPGASVRPRSSSWTSSPGA